MSAWTLAGSVAAGLVVVWAALLGALLLAARREPDRTGLRDVLRLVPDVVRLLRRLASDRSLPRGVRVRLGLVVAYLAVPIDLVPDVLPVVGLLDDALMVALVLRSVVRAAGPDALERHWPGSPAGLEAVRRVAGVRRPT
jgi:uncharacterized membrane protein YkvA (DUF1232 family)